MVVKRIKSRAEVTITGVLVLTFCLLVSASVISIMTYGMTRLRVTNEVTKVQEVFSYAGVDGSWGNLNSTSSPYRVSTLGCESVPTGSQFTRCVETKALTTVNSLHDNLKCTLSDHKLSCTYDGILLGVAQPQVLQQNFTENLLP